MKPNKPELMLALFLIGLIIASWSAWALYKTYTTKTEQVMVRVDNMLCGDVHSVFLDQDGWQRATAADRPQMVALERRGLLEWREEKSLQCHDALDPAKEWLAGELWFRAKVKHAGEGTAYEGGA